MHFNQNNKQTWTPPNPAPSSSSSSSSFYPRFGCVTPMITPKGAGNGK